VLEALARPENLALARRYTIVFFFFLVGFSHSSDFFIVDVLYFSPVHSSLSGMGDPTRSAKLALASSRTSLSFFFLNKVKIVKKPVYCQLSGNFYNFGQLSVH
jgi:hypothetical protein